MPCFYPCLFPALLCKDCSHWSRHEMEHEAYFGRYSKRSKGKSLVSDGWTRKRTRIYNYYASTPCTLGTSDSLHVVHSTPCLLSLLPYALVALVVFRTPQTQRLKSRRRAIMPSLRCDATTMPARPCRTPRADTSWAPNSSLACDKYHKPITAACTYLNTIEEQETPQPLLMLAGWRGSGNRDGSPGVIGDVGPRAASDACVVQNL